MATATAPAKYWTMSLPVKAQRRQTAHPPPPPKESKEIKTKHSNKEAEKEVGALIAKRAKEKKIETVVFDRSGYIYHGVVKELAESAREGGLKF